MASVLGVATSVIVLPDESWKPLWRFFEFLHFSCSAGWGEVEWSPVFFVFTLPESGSQVPDFKSFTFFLFVALFTELARLIALVLLLL